MRRATGSGVFAAGFAKNVQELEHIRKRKAAGQIVNDRDLAKYAFELQGFHAEDAGRLAEHYNSRSPNACCCRSHEKEYRRNVVTPPKQRSEITKLLLSFLSGFNPLLLIAAALSFLAWKMWNSRQFNDYFLVIGIMFLLVVKQTTETVLKSHQQLLPATCMVVRSDEIREVPVRSAEVQLTPLLMRVVSSSGLKVDKSLLTGESRAIRATADSLPESTSYLEAINTVFMGYHVVDGHGMGLVVSTGPYTQLGKIVRQTCDKPKSPLLQSEIRRVVITQFTIAAVIVIVLGFYWAFYLRVKYRDFVPPSDFILRVVGVVVAVVLIGLPFAAGGGLSIISRRLMREHSMLTKPPHGIATLGTITMLAADKTGTLTENELMFAALISASDVLERLDRASVGKTDGVGVLGIQHTAVQTASTNGAVIQTSYRIAALCNEAQLMRDDFTMTAGGSAYPRTLDEPDVETGVAERPSSAVGSKSTDRALLNWVKDNTDLNQILADHTVLASIPFSPRTKRAISVVRHNTSGAVFVVAKGAPERVLPLCSHYMAEGSERMEMIEAFRGAVMELVEGEGIKGHRALVTALIGPLSDEQFPVGFEFQCEVEPNFPVADFTFVSCISLADPPREGVAEAVRALCDAHILVAMVTGDAVSSAVATARQVGIISESSTTVDTVHTLHRRMGAAMQEPAGGAIVVTGDEVDSISPLEWDFVFNHTELVFARTTPNHKLLILKQSMARGHVVGVTGHGVNDAPSLKRADVGIAMNTGSDVAREAAGIVLLNDDFGSIVHGVWQGRVMFANLRKVIAFLLSTGSAAILYAILIMYFFGFPRPLTVFGMLIISMITDVFGGLALMQESAEIHLVQQMPHVHKTKRLMKWKVIVYAYLFIAPLLTVGEFYNYFLYMSKRGDHQSASHSLPPSAPDLRTPVGYSAHDLLFASDWNMFTGTALSRDQLAAHNMASSIYFMTLLVGQMAYLIGVCKQMPYFYEDIFNTRGAEGSVAQRMWHTVRSTGVNWPTVGDITASGIIVAIVLYVPWFHRYCYTAPVSGRYWGVAIGWSALWFVVGQIRTWIIFGLPDTWVNGLGW